MARASELVEVITDATGLEPTTVTRYARFAREGGFLSQSGRGNSAARMKTVDAANLLACILVNGIAQEAAAQIQKVMEMAVYSRDADHLDDRHLSPEDQQRLRKILPIVFDRDHTLHELLVTLVDLATQDWQDFEHRFGHSQIYLYGDDSEALVYFDISLDDEIPGPLGRSLDFQFSYSHPVIGQRSPDFRRSTQMSFSLIARVGKLIARK